MSESAYHLGAESDSAASDLSTFSFESAANYHATVLYVKLWTLWLCFNLSLHTHLEACLVANLDRAHQFFCICSWRSSIA